MRWKISAALSMSFVSPRRIGDAIFDKETSMYSVVVNWGANYSHIFFIFAFTFSHKAGKYFIHFICNWYTRRRSKLCTNNPYKLYLNWKHLISVESEHLNRKSTTRIMIAFPGVTAKASWHAHGYVFSMVLLPFIFGSLLVCAILSWISLETACNLLLPWRCWK